MRPGGNHRRAPGDGRRKAGIAGFEVGARPENGIGGNDGARVAPGQVLAQRRLIVGLIIDAGINTDHPQFFQQAHDLLFLGHFAAVLPQTRGVAHVHAAGVGGGVHRATPTQPLQTPQEIQPAVADQLNVRHDMRIGDGHEPFGLEKISHFNLIGQRLFDGLSLFAAQHAFFLIRQAHCSGIHIRLL